MYIIGISCFYHDSAACLLKDGKIVAAAEEERFTRKKHDNSFPINAIKFCLKNQRITIKDIDYVSFYEKPLLKFERVLYQHIYSFPKSWKAFVNTMPSWIAEKLRVQRIIRKKLKYKGDIFFVKHHMSHASSAFLPSPFEKSAIFTVDGVGEWETLSYGIGEKNNIRLLKKIDFPHSMGLLYSTITTYLGFKANNGEFKVMGLSPYGNLSRKNPYYKKLKKVIDIREDGSFSLDISYFDYLSKERMASKKLILLLGERQRKSDEPLTKKHKDIAAALQLITEEVIIKILNHVHKETKCPNLVMSGGVALNSVINGKILEKTPFKNIWIQPAASDSGNSIGCALYAYNCILNNKRDYVIDNLYLGPEYSDIEIKKILDKKKIPYEKIETGKLIKKTASLIHENKIVALFQGRMEYGPRALGNRSILASPLTPEMKDIINSKVKHREAFRPFAPAVCYEDTEKYFDIDLMQKPSRFMLMVCNVKSKKIPGVTHVNNTARIQVVEKKQNIFYYNLIKEFGKLSSVSVLLNTSFNVRGEPIVCSPEDAVKCFLNTGN
jgi:carbamoyltransferase